MSEAREVELSSPALMALSDLRDHAQPADHYRPEILDELQKVGFVRNLPNNKVGITTTGVDHLMPPGKPRPYVPPVQRTNGAGEHNATTPPVTPPAAVTPPASKSPAPPQKLIGSTFVLAALKKAGGSMTQEALNADGRTLRKLIQDGQVILDMGQVILDMGLVKLTNGKKPVPAAPPSTAASAPPPPVVLPPVTQAEPVASASTPPSIEAHACKDDCATCATGRALAFLTSSSPALAAMVERFQAHEADQQRLHSFDS